MNGLIFDVDGVIADSEKVNAIASIKVFSDLFGVEGVKREDFELGLGRGSAEYVLAAARIHGLELTEEQVRQATEARQENFLNILRSKPLVPFPGVMPLIQNAMEDPDFRVAIATSSAREKSEAVLKSARIPYQKLVYITGDDVRRKKPDPEVFQKAVEGIGLPPENCVVIEDAPDGVKAAHAAGCRCIAVTNSTSRHRLSDADRIVDSLEEITIEDLISVLRK